MIELTVEAFGHRATFNPTLVWDDEMVILIWIDADACPRMALQIAQSVGDRHGARVRTVSTWRHELNLEGHVTVDAAPQATDLAILARMSKHDVVITQDYGLAALVLARGGHALSPSGLRFTEENIDTLLAARSDMARLRKASRSRRSSQSPAVRVKGPSKRTDEDDRHFREALEKLLDFCESL